MTVGEAISDGLGNNDVDWPNTSDGARGCYFSGHSQGALLGSEYFSVQNYC